MRSAIVAAVAGLASSAAAFTPASGHASWAMARAGSAAQCDAVQALSKPSPASASAVRRALLLAGGVLAGQVAAVGPAAAFENRVVGVDLVPGLKGKPYGALTPVPAGVGEAAQLRGCPSTEEVARPPPNCFSTAAPKPSGDDELYWTAPFSFKGKSAKQAMDDLLEVAQAYPPGQAGIDAGGWKIVKRTDNYLYMQFESGRIGYIDDLEFLIDDAKQSAGLRSASRAGFLDFAVNAKRVNWFAAALGKKGWSTSPITPGNHPDYFRQNGEA